MRRAGILSLAAILTISTVVGCSGEKKMIEPANTAPAVKKPPTEFSIAYTTTFTSGYAQRQPDLSKEKWVLALNRLTNTEQTVKQVEEFKLPLLLAGNDITDVIRINGGPTSKLMNGSVEDGVFMALDDLLSNYAPNLLKSVPKNVWEHVSYQGKIYAIPGYLSNPSRRATFVQQNLLDQVGLPAPKTVDDFLNVLRAFKKIGVEHPYQGRQDLKYADVVFGAYDVIPYRDQYELINGQVMPKFLKADSMMKALQVYKTMYDEGLIAKDFATLSSTDYLKNIRSGKAGMWSANNISLRDFTDGIKAVNPNAKVVVIPSPTGPDGKGGYFYYAPLNNATYINKNVKPDTAIGIMKYLDWMVSKEADYFFNLGTLGETYQMENGKVTRYFIPKTPEEGEELSWRSNMRIGVDGNRPSVKPQDEIDQAVQFYADTILNNEGRSGIAFSPDLEAYAKYPDLAFPAQDAPPRLIVDHMIKMIYGREPISDWPKVVEEYKTRGGNEIINEATDRYNKKVGAFFITK